MRFLAQTLLLFVASGLSASVLAQVVPGQGDAWSWLQKVSTAARQLSYSGTFVFQNGTRSETSRILHVAKDGGQFEKLEVLDGSPREVVRHNDEVTCYLPEKRLVVIEQRSPRISFPALLPASLVGLGEHYQIRKGVVVRVAGRESQLIKLESRDAWRFGRQFWIDQENGLLLKAEVLSAQGDSLESLVFTELQIGMPAGTDVTKLSAATSERVRDWAVRKPRVQELREELRWQFRSELPGFRRQSAMLRSFDRLSEGDAREVKHWVFSDGLAAVSVFISPLTGTSEIVDGEMETMGAISVMKRVVDGHKVVVMGDVPPGAIRHFAAGIGVRSK
jgi:sigma-E factor negative regulatory protein RseB